MSENNLQDRECPSVAATARDSSLDTLKLPVELPVPKVDFELAEPLAVERARVHEPVFRLIRGIDQTLPGDRRESRCGRTGRAGLLLTQHHRSRDEHKDGESLHALVLPSQRIEISDKVIQLARSQRHCVTGHRRGLDPLERVEIALLE